MLPLVYNYFTILHFGYDSTYNGKTGFIAMAGFLNLIPGSMILPLLFEFINTKEIILSSFFNFIGQNTLYIYIIHYFLNYRLLIFQAIKDGLILFLFIYQLYLNFTFSLSV